MIMGNVYAEDIIWQEDFSSFEENGVPAGSTYKLGAGNTASDNSYTKGKVVSISEIATSYKNATFTISDDGTISGSSPVLFEENCHLD